MAASAARRQAGNLPAEVTSFVGRRREMSEARRLLGHTRLLTLAGPGGVGKTRLALSTAGQLRRVFTDGVWLVDLASVHEPELLAVTVLHTLHVHDQSARPPAAVLRDYLADKSLLLILDNCEHLLDSSAELATELLRGAPGLRILVTSREPLRVGGEQVLPVPPLSAPEAGESAAEDLAGYEAVALFAERAAAVVPGFTVHDDNADAVAQVVRRLDGIPLAIELAAVQLRALSLAGLRDRMDDLLGALVTGTRDAPSRQRTLRAMIDSSFELCSPMERTLWARLSVFSASFDLNAAQAVCAGDGLPDDVVDLVMGLIDKSVLLREEHGHQVRYRLLETIRQYGRRRLATSGEEQRLRGAHRDFYRRLAVRMGAEWYGPRQVEWFDRMRVEHPNIRAALDFCLGEPGDVPAGLEIAIALRVYWHASMTLTEGRRWLGRLLERYRTPSPLRAAALRTASLLALYHNDLDGATPIVRESRDLARSLDDPLLVAWSALPAGFAALLREDLPSAIDSFQEALDGLRAAHDEGDALLPLMLLATSVWMAGDAERAAALGEECVSRSRSLGETWMRAWMLWTLGVVAWRQGDTRRATELEREAIQIKRAFGDRPGMGQCAEVLAWTAAAEGRCERAALLLGGVQAIWRQTGSTLYRFFDRLHHDVQEQLCGILGRSAFETAFRCGTELTVEDVVSTAVEEKPSAPEGPASTTPDELTRREEEIAELIAQGLTNRQIATQLVISQRTAETHVDHILTKLGFTSRVQIAGWVSARHPAPPRRGA